MEKRNRKQPKEKMQRGARNLVILGLLSILIALTTTSVALAIYHNSGDIYLDRSRPGYLPDEEEIEQDEKEPEKDDYEFNKNTKLTKEDITEYLKELQEEMDAINAYEKPFGAEILSDEHLGIPNTEGATNNSTEVELRKDEPIE